MPDIKDITIPNTMKITKEAAQQILSAYERRRTLTSLLNSLLTTEDEWSFYQLIKRDGISIKIDGVSIRIPKDVAIKSVEDEIDALNAKFNLVE